MAVNSKGHVFVFTRSNSANGPAYAPSAAQLLEFSPKGEFIREIGKGLYAWSFAHSVRIDRDDNIWAIDKCSDMVVKFNQSGQVMMALHDGRREDDRLRDDLRGSDDLHAALDDQLPDEARRNGRDRYGHREICLAQYRSRGSRPLCA